jgi:LPS export ABC transporter protein LptC
MSPRRVAKALASFGAVALIALLGVTVWVVRHRTPVQIAQTAAGMLPGSLLHAHNFHWTQMKAGERQWELTASDASYSSDRTSLTLNNAELTMVSDDGKPVKVQAPRAMIVLDGNHVKQANLSGGTVIHYGTFVMTTPDVHFMPDDDKVDAPGAVTMEGEGVKVTGIGMTGNPKTRVFQLLDKVTTDISPKQQRDNPKTS